MLLGNVFGSAGWKADRQTVMPEYEICKNKEYGEVIQSINYEHAESYVEMVEEI